MEQPQRDHVAGPEVLLGVLGHGAQLLIDVVEQGGDTLHSDHGLLRARQGFTRLTSVEDVHDHCKVPSEYEWCVKDAHHRLWSALIWHPIFTQDGPAGSAAMCSAASITSRPQAL